MSPIILCLPYPPSVNGYWRHVTKGPLAGRSLISERGRSYRKQVEQIFLVDRIGSVGAQRVAVDIEARMPDRRVRDLDNITKALLDALTHAKFWDDDSQVDDLRVWRAPQRGGVVLVRVTVLDAMAEQPSLL